MNITDFTYLINKPEAVNQKQSDALEKVLIEFPYFQSARALQLKGLYNQDSYKYNNALKVTATHTTDRTVLFDFITSNTFVAVQKGLYDKKVQELLNIGVVDHEIIKSELNIETKTKFFENEVNPLKQLNISSSKKNKYKGFKSFLEAKDREDSINKLKGKFFKKDSTFIRAAFFSPSAVTIRLRRSRRWLLRDSLPLLLCRLQFHQQIQAVSKQTHDRLLRASRNF